MIAKLSINKNNSAHVKAAFEILAVQKGIEQAKQDLGLADTEVLEKELNDKVVLIKSWQAGLTVTIGEHYTHLDNTYIVIQAHTTQADWQPQNVPALFLLRPKPQVGDDYPQWVQPTGGHDAYNTGDRVTFEGANYESTINANVWSPVVHGWRLI